MTSDANFVVIARKLGCVELWNVREKKRIATTRVDPKTHASEYGIIYVIVRAGAVVVGDKSAFDLQSLKPVDMPKFVEEPEPKTKSKDSAMAIRDLEPALAKALEKWAPRMNINVTVEDRYTWIAPKIPKYGDPPYVRISQDGKLLQSDARLVRLDTGKMHDFVPWTNGFTAMSDETFPGTLSISFGPRLDRVVVFSSTRMGAGTNISSAMLVDTNTMKTIAPLAESCEDDYAYWSPRGTWVMRQPCDHGVLASEDEATFVETGKIVRKIPSKDMEFAADDNIGVARGIVMNLATGEVLLRVPEPTGP